MNLKQYQLDTLGVLRRFLEQARTAGPQAAYDSLTNEPDTKARLGRYRTPYTPLDALPATPYVCLRLPTGGGKTILAGHAIGVARDAWVEKDHPLVLWLVPSNTIRLQTVEALRNPRHPYRQAVDGLFDSRVRVFNITDFTDIRPHDIRDNACIVVGTIQTLKVNNTEGRKVYAHNESMEPHFSTVPRNLPGLEQIDGSTDRTGHPRFSFANLLHVHRPLMIVDEAHNAVTGLTRVMQARVNPCAIIEFTATPRFNSNILYSVSAQELKDAQMIKLPIILAEHDTWQAAVNGAISSRAALAEAAMGETDYIRPIVLFQAQQSNQDVPPDVLKTHLMEVEQIPEDRIAIATGDQRELDGIDLFDPTCRIEYVITMQALKEGWDCSFAYVFCSLSRIQSATDVEQLLGRVLRMPYAQRRRDESLNHAFAHVSETSFGAAAVALTDKLVAMGFDETEAREAIEPAQGHLDETGLFAPRETAPPVFRHVLPINADAVAALIALPPAAGIAITATDGAVEIAITGRVTPEAEAALIDALPPPARAGFAEAVRQYRVEIKDRLSFAARGEEFRLPRLMAEVQGELEFADPDLFMDNHAWSILSYPARLDEAAFAIRETARSFEIDVDHRRVVYQFASEQEQLALDVPVEGWTQANLVNWLERQLRRDDLHPAELNRWVSDGVGHLVGARKISVPALMRAKFILANTLRARIDAACAEEQERVYQQCLFAPQAHVELSFDNGFVFHDGMYRDVRKQPPGRWKPRKHYLGAENVPAFDGNEGGEEMQCAQVIDSLPQVDFWLRNVARHRSSFWLPLASGRFYPDFVAQLRDGRRMVVEYKGDMLAGPGNDDTNAKRAIGRRWAQCGPRTCLFVMVENQIADRDMRAQLQDAIGA